MDRAVKPYEQVKAMLGNASSAWEKLVGYVRYYYIMDEQWVEGNPTHKNYNNLYVRRSGKSLIMFGIREGYFIACIVLGKDEREKFENQRENFGKVVCKEYDEAETYHDGKWLAFDVCDESLIDDIIRLIHIKRKPNRKILPECTEKDSGGEAEFSKGKFSESFEKCGCLDLGLSHEDITNYLTGVYTNGKSNKIIE